MPTKSATPLLLAFAFLAAVLPCCGDSASIEAVGLWSVAKLYRLSDTVADMTDAQAKALVGKTVNITPKSARVGRATCESYDRKVESFNRDTIVRGAPAPPVFHMPQNVTVVYFGCGEVWLRDANSAILPWKGFYFELRRIIRK